MTGKNALLIRLVRPVFGLTVAITWGIQMSAVAFVMLFRTEKAAEVIRAMESLSTTWAVGLSVLGIYVYKRSGEKMKENEKDA